VFAHPLLDVATKLVAEGRFERPEAGL
jgi:hypothetical protein